MCVCVFVGLYFKGATVHSYYNHNFVSTVTANMGHACGGMSASTCELPVLQARLHMHIITRYSV